MRIKQVLAGVLVTALLLQSVLTPAQASALSAAQPFTSLTPSPRIASLMMASAALGKSPQKPDVIIIQDLHFNYSVQKNIARLLEFLHEKGAVGPVLAVEGAVGEVDNSLLTEVGNLDVREEIADFLMRNGELTGSQHFSVMSGQPKLLHGVEDPAYFQSNREIFRLSYGLRQQALRQVVQLRSRMQTLVPALCSRAVRRLQRAEERFDSGKISMEAYWAILRDAGEARGVPMPGIMADYLSANSERRHALAMDSSLYQALSDYETAVEVAHAITPNEQNLIRVLAELHLMESALHQRATLDQVRHVAARMDQTASLVRLLSGEIGPATDVDGLKEALRASVDFYVAALMRNGPLLENTLKQMPANGDKPTVLIAGGFHTPYLSKELSRRGLSFAVFTPQLDSHTSEDQELYVARLLGERLTEGQALEWLAARGGIRGSPTRASMLAYVPFLRDLPWLSSWISVANQSHSFYDRKILTRLRENFEYRFLNRHDLNMEDLTNELFERDDVLPGGAELRGVLSLFKQAGISLPIDRISLLLGDEVSLKKKGDRYAPWVTTKLPREDTEFILEIIRTKGDRYTIYAHQDALTSHPGFKKDPFNFWLMVMLHELAHTRGVKHAALSADKLDTDYDISMSAQEMVRKYAAHIPDITALLADRGGIEAILAISAPAYRYLRANDKESDHKLKLRDLTPKAIASISDFSEHVPHVPGVDYWPAEKGDFKVLPSVLPEDQMVAAREQESTGAIVEEIFAGGAATRIRGYINIMVELGLLSQTKSKLLWNTQLRDFPKAMKEYLQRLENKFSPEETMQRDAIARVYEDIEEILQKYAPDMTFADVLQFEDWSHWGARVMLSINAYVRQQARAGGFNEEQALKKKRILFHVADEDIEGMANDFIDHNNYGFGEILFVVNKPGPLIYAHAETNAFRLADPQMTLSVDEKPLKVGSIVYGHGPATLALGNKEAAHILLPGQDREVLRGPGNGRISAADYLRKKLKNQKDWAIREHRLNDLGLLEMGDHDLRMQAYFNILSQDPNIQCSVLFQMVRNPGQFMVSLKTSQEDNSPVVDVQMGGHQAGGVSYVFKGDHGTRVMPVETGATGGRTNEMLKNYTRGKPATDYLNAMRTLKRGDIWMEAVNQEVLTYFFGVHKSPSADSTPLQYTREDGILLKPQTATGHLALQNLNAQSVIFPEGDKRGTLNDGKTEDIMQTLSMVRSANLQDSSALVLAVAEDLGIDINALKRKNPQLAAAISDEKIKIGMAKRMQAGNLKPRQAHLFALAAAIPILIGVVLLHPLAWAAAPWGIAALGQEYAVLKRAVVGGNAEVLFSNKPIARYSFGSQSMRASVDSIPVRAEELAHALTQSESEVLTRLVAPFALLLAAIDAVVGGLFGLANWAAAKLNHAPPPDFAVLDGLNQHAEKINALLAMSRSPGKPMASRAWTGLQARVQAAWGLSSARREAEELAARQLISMSA